MTVSGPIEPGADWEEIRKTVGKFTSRVVKVVAILIVSVGFDVLLTAGLITYGSRLQDTQADLKVAQADLKETQRAQNAFLRDRCEAANDASDKQHRLWDAVILQSGGSLEDERVVQFRKILDEIFVKRDCSKELKGTQP